MDVSNNFMLGEALKVSIQTDSNNDNATYYFPADAKAPHATWWCNLLNASADGCVVGGKSYEFAS